ncbi:hydrolase [Sutcliffiella rhizosphaerae]|uniref:Spore coat protein n=1 Tax=Sutcliffiella rhizosphaerae TaxID=2880967 RepID=A0ABN8A557_9BACI|nr:hydrolase [Sutcliffiella rhizosphaerae]CAG9620255.1 hypothetical protein BACCIP111883_01023 [Sutcliffiella rhizosphaerae]
MKYYYQSQRSKHEEHDCGCKKKKHECEGCVCDQLRKLQIQTELDLFLKGGTVVEDVLFISFDRKNCCAIFSDPTTEPGSTLVFDCTQIIGIRLERD